MNASDAAGPREPDVHLLRRFVAGETDAHRTVERWAREVVFHHGLGLAAADQDDAVQDTIAALWRAASRPDFELRHGTRALVRTIAVARCIDRMRRRRIELPLDPQAPGASRDPLELAMANDESARVRRALLELDPPCREIVRLHYFEQLSYAEIAAREGRSESTMRVRMFHCMKAIRKRVAAWAARG
jgi:RNA polymerase sigma-70 factor (ECF subfamily)